MPTPNFSPASDDDDKLNYYMSARHGNMLGKGTFVVRKGTAKKHPKAKDVFHSSADSLDVSFEIPPPPPLQDMSSLSPEESVDSLKQLPDPIPSVSNSRNSLDLSSSQRSSMTSPR